MSDKSGRLIIFLLAMVFFAATTTAQPFTLQQAESRARKGYPLIKQQGLIEKTSALTVSNLAKGYVPQLALGGQASYQSDVTKVSIPNAPFVVEPPSKDQYRLTMDISQLIYDGGLIRNQQQLSKLQGAAESSRIELELYKLQERVDQLYCSILYVDAQLVQLKLVKTDIQTGINKVSTQIENGVAFKSALNTLKAEALKIDQRGIELNAMRRGLIEVMGILTDTVLTESIQLEIPELNKFQAEGAIQKQLNLFKAQQDLNAHQLDLLQSKSLPKASAFLQAGYGRPGLNMLKNEFQWFSIGGLRLNWSISNLYTSKNEKELNAVASSTIAVQQETYLKNANAQVRQQMEEVEKFRQLIEADHEIIALRNAVKEAAAAQLEAGVITASDYIREVNAADQSSQALKAHELQWLQANIQLEILRGKK